MPQENNEFPGYHMLGRLWAIGYIRGLIDASTKQVVPGHPRAVTIAPESPKVVKGEEERKRAQQCIMGDTGKVGKRSRGE